MSLHDSRLSGTITIAAGVTREQLYAAAAPYLEHHKLSHNLVDPQAAAAPVPGFAGVDGLAITFDEEARELTFYADVRGRGGYTDELREALIDALSPLVNGPQVLEFEDFDSGSLEDSMCPSFFGPTPRDGVRARLRYAADQFDSWAAHSGLSGIVRSIVDSFPVDGFVSETGVRAMASGVLRTDLLVTVLHERERSLSLQDLDLSDIHMLISEGEAIGQVAQLEERELAIHEVRSELLAISNDGDFFDAADTAREVAQAAHDLSSF
jgi:hypothetical protein